MSNFVLFIGGTGARVYRSFLHICAAGAVQEKEINVLLLDADAANQAADASCKLYQLYQFHHQHLQSAGANAAGATPAFHCDIRMPVTRAISPVLDKVSCLEHVAKEDERRLRAMRWFYSKKEREQDLKNGFYAHPNIGCVFYQDFRDGATQAFLEHIQNDLQTEEAVRVVLVGSVFGGTGASGLPSIMKQIYANCGGHREKLHCYGVLVTPYFEVPAPGDSERRENLVINSDAFYRNTRAALEYYQEHGIFERTYLVGKDQLDQVSLKYTSGGPDQENKSHIVEICAAMAVKDSFEGERPPGTWVHMIHEESVTWMTLGRELYPVADMIRMQVVLKGSIYPYIKEMPRQTRPWCPCKQWYKVFRAGSVSGDTMAQLEQYTNDFLSWIYDVQTGVGAKERVLDGSVQLCRTLVTDLAGCLELAEGKDISKKEKKSALARFNDVIDTAANIEYVFDKIILILSCLGVVKQSLAGLGCFGLLIRLLEIAGQKKAQRGAENN